MDPHLNPWAVIHGSMQYQRIHDKKKLAEDDDEFDKVLEKALHDSDGDDAIRSVETVEGSPETDLNNHSTAYEQAHLMQQRRNDSRNKKEAPGGDS
ncbi:MAG: hypothetical protein O3A01_04550 [bacterium]|nr:hypothetical protein [bacterium]